MTIAVSSEVYEGIEWVNNAAIYDPFNWPLIVTVLGASGYTASANWIENEPEKYIQGIFFGFSLKEDKDIFDRLEKNSPGWL